MRIGVIFPQNEIGDDPLAVRDFVQAAEQLGYSHIVAFDHVLGAERSDRQPPLWGPYGDADMFHEPLTLFSYMAAISHRIGFATGVLVLPQRQTALVAKQAAQVALLSGGRFRLGVGVGWNHVEFEALGCSFSDRGRRQEEQIDVLRRLWSGEIVDYTGRFHRIDRASLSPAPPGPVPVWIGGFSERAHARACRIADGFIFSRPSTEGGAAGVVELGLRMRERVAELGRDPDGFGLEARLSFGIDRPAASAEIERYRAAGFDFAAVNMQREGVGDAAAHLRAIERFAREAGVGGDADPA